LVPSFEEAEKKKVQVEDEIKAEKENRGNQQALLEAAKEPST
jgi:hypothetical protein